MTFSNKKTIMALMLTTLLSQTASPMDQRDHKHSHEFHSIIMPGQNGAGGSSFQQNNVVNTPEDRTSRYQTLWGSSIDMGQGNCIRDFERQYKADSKAQATNAACLFYGVSQGTATLTNWLAQKSHAEQERTAKLLVLEGVLGSGNRGIMHTIESGASIATYLPFARAWMPFVAKILFPTYNPFGKNALASAKKLSPNLPVVIMHNKGDQQLSINDARELYCTLRKQGNNNAYLMEVDNGAAHFDVLNNNYHGRWCTQQDKPEMERIDKERKEKIIHLQAIYRAHNLPAAPGAGAPRNSEVTQQYQPSVQEVKQRISATNGYKNIIRNSIDILSGALILGSVWWKYFASK